MADSERSPHQSAIDHLVTSLASFDPDQRLTDLTITCQGREWAVHRVVISIHSTTLAASSTQSFKEAEDRTIDLPDDEPDCVDAMVNFFYKLDYSAANFTDLNHLAVHTKMCINADRYRNLPLHQLAIERFKQYSDSTMHSEQEITDAAKIAYDYMEPTEETRTYFVSQIVKNKNRLLMESSRGRCLEQLMRVCPELSMDISMAALFPDLPVPPQGIRCRNCGSLDLRRGGKCKIATHCWDCGELFRSHQGKVEQDW